MKELQNQQLFVSIKQIIVEAILLTMYWQIGKLIVENEQNGKERAEYGKSVLKNLSSQLQQEFGKWYDESNLRNIRQFYLAFPIRDALRHELNWTLPQEDELKALIENDRIRFDMDKKN